MMHGGSPVKKGSRQCTIKTLCVQCYGIADNRLIRLQHTLHVSGNVVHACVKRLCPTRRAGCK